MASQYSNILNFNNLVIGVATPLPHNLNFNGRAVTPDELIPQIGGFTVIADATNVTVTRLEDSPADGLIVLAKSWHTMMRAFGATVPAPGAQPDGSLLVQPFVYTAGQAGVPGRYAPPDQWFQDNVAANQSAVRIATRVTLLTNPFTGIMMIRAGTVVGLNTRFSEVVTVGEMIVQVGINNVLFAPSLNVTSTPASNSLGGQATSPSGASFVPGDIVTIAITTDAAFLPATLDMEAWVDIDTN